jgi:NifU-like protein involved in Fe-S cluster formation
MKYNELTRRYFEHPVAAGELSDPKARGAAGSRAQGTWVQFDIRVGGGRGARSIEAARFLAFGCPHVIAACAWIAECAVGREIELRLPESVPALRERLAAPVEKLGRLLIVEDAWLAAVRAAAAQDPDH